MGNLSPAQAAAEISALINSHARSPLPSALEAIIARVSVSPGPSPQTAALLSELRRLRLLYLAAYGAYLDAEKTPAEAALEARADALYEQFKALAEQVRQRPIETWHDVAMYAEIALSWNMGALDELLDSCPHMRDLTALVAAVAYMSGCPVRPIAREHIERGRESWGAYDVGWLERFIEPGIAAPGKGGAAHE